MIISTELYGEHKDHYSIYEIESYLGSNNLEWVDSDTVDTMGAIKEAIQDGRNYIVLPVSNDSDITINFTYEV